MSSSFKEVLWIDTDVTLLVRPERLFETEEFRRTGALFWPDLWGRGCRQWGPTSWPHHIAWHLLEMDYNESDHRCYQEHELGHALIDKDRHWPALCLANFLNTRDFWQRVLWGYKDVFRLAWHKLGADNWLGPVRPGLAGAYIRDGRFLANALVHFWPPTGELGSMDYGRPVPLYVHQKKKPGQLWQEVVSFKPPMGECVKYHVGPFNVQESDAEIWNIATSHPELYEALQVADATWDEAHEVGRQRLLKDPRMPKEEIDQLEAGPAGAPTREFFQSVNACSCTYDDNAWFLLISAMIEVPHMVPECKSILKEDFDASACNVGYAALALLCSLFFAQLVRFSAQLV